MKFAQAGHSTVSVMPAWLEGMLSEKFFSPCAAHSAVKKNERNVYCLECIVAICQHCLSNHDHHKLLQIRRYVYHDVVRMQDIQKLLDCSYVQPYIINSAKAVFLNERPQPRPSKGAGNVCEFCERCLQDGYNFCSVGCKVKAFAKQGKSVQSLLSHDDSNLPALGFTTSSSSSCCLGETIMMNEGMAVNTSLEEDEYHEQQHSPNSVLGGPTPTSSGSTANNSLTWGGTMATATKKLRTSLMHSKPVVMAPVTPSSSILPNSSLAAKLKASKRRKSTPQRSPTF